jgi:DNA (cytosine-5)-methyltransferase 1
MRKSRSGGKRQPSPTLEPCERCRSDQDFLRSKQRPSLETPSGSFRAADLFAGCGGMSIGMEEAARSVGKHLTVAFAVDADPNILDIYKRNVTGTVVRAADVAKIFDGDLGERLTASERKIEAEVGTLSILLGGPPCQGHSDLNNHTRRNDPKNGLYLTMARATEVLKPQFVVIENVVSVQRDQSGVVQLATMALEQAGYSVSGRVLDLWKVGVPQRRRRFVLLASRMAAVEPSTILDSVTEEWGGHPPRTVDWAIRDLLDIESQATFDTPSKKSKENTLRMAYLFEKGIYNLPNERRPDCHRDGDHSYLSVYGRLRWNQPAQTITTGFGSMGQGRYVHPQRRRTITPHEAARLQTFPDWFDFGADTSRGVLAKAIGNAVPPLLMVALGRLIIAALNASEMAERKRA